MSGIKVTKKDVENLDKTNIEELRVTKDDDEKGIREINTIKN